MSALPPTGIGADEWATRCELAAPYRLVAHLRMTDLIDTHLSARVPGLDAHFLINRCGLPFEEMRASDLVKVDLDGRVVDARGAGRRALSRQRGRLHDSFGGARGAARSALGDPHPHGGRRRGVGAGQAAQFEC